MRTGILLCWAAAACKGTTDTDTDDTILPPDGDTDTDADTDEDTDTDDDTDVPVEDRCGPLADVGGIPVATTDDLADAVAAAADGDTLLLADGTHRSEDGPIVIDKAITIRSASGNRELAIVDSDDLGNHMFVVQASGVTFAHLTMRASYDDIVHVEPIADMTGPTLYDVHIIDAGRYGLTVADGDGPWADGGTVACSTFELTDARRPFVRNGCDTGGIDAYGARGWTVRDNVFSSFWCTASLANPNIRFWRGSRDTVITRNTLIDAPYGIVLGETQDAIGRTYTDLPECGPGILQHVYGTVTNNIVSVYDDDLLVSSGGALVGIRVHSSCEAQVIHNSLQSSIEPAAASIDARYETTSGLIANNLVSWDLVFQDNAEEDTEAPVGSNMENVPATTWFHPAMDNFHTAPTSDAIDAGIATFVTDDVDAEPRVDGLPDIGADEQ